MQILKLNINKKRMSHFSFTRSLYDQCEINKKNEESTGPFNILVDTKVPESKDSCYLNTSPFMRNPNKSIPSQSIDVESDLLGNTRPISKCISRNYSPSQKNGKLEPTSSYPIPKLTEDCDEKVSKGLTPEYTRVSKPCNIFSGITINRFNPLGDDIQDLNTIHSNSYIGVNTRLAVRDKYKKEVSDKKKYDFTFDPRRYCYKCSYLKY